MFNEWKRGDCQKKIMKWSPPGRRKRGRPKLTWAEEIRGLMEEKGLMEEDWNDRQLEEEYNIIVKWAQEDVETSYNLLNNNNKLGRVLETSNTRSLALTLHGTWTLPSPKCRVLSGKLLFPL